MWRFWAAPHLTVHLEDTHNLSFYSKPSQVSSRKNSQAHYFQGNPHKLISIERLWNVEFNNITFCFTDYFLKAAEAVISKAIDWNSRELIEYRVWGIEYHFESSERSLYNTVKNIFQYLS